MCNCIDEDIFHEYVNEKLEEIRDEVDTMIDYRSSLKNNLKQQYYKQFIEFNKQFYEILETDIKESFSKYNNQFANNIMKDFKSLLYSVLLRNRCGLCEQNQDDESMENFMIVLYGEDDNLFKSLL